MNVSALKNCARCGKNHKALKFKKFKRACKGWTYWAICPVSKDPILMQVKLPPSQEAA